MGFVFMYGKSLRTSEIHSDNEWSATNSPLELWVGCPSFTDDIRNYNQWSGFL